MAGPEVRGCVGRAGKERACQKRQPGGWTRSRYSSPQSKFAFLIVYIMCFRCIPCLTHWENVSCTLPHEMPNPYVAVEMDSIRCMDFWIENGNCNFWCALAYGLTAYLNVGKEWLGLDNHSMGCLLSINNNKNKGSGPEDMFERPNCHISNAKPWMGQLSWRWQLKLLIFLPVKVVPLWYMVSLIWSLDIGS
jgi:hypothetical protein